MTVVFRQWTLVLVRYSKHNFFATHRASQLLTTANMPLNSRNRVSPLLTLNASTLSTDHTPSGQGHVALEIGQDAAGEQPTNDVTSSSSRRARATSAATAAPSLHRSLTEDMYKASLLFNDLSYAKAYAHNIEHYSKKITDKQRRFMSRLAADEAEIMRKIRNLNFDLCKVVYGKTGSRNQREDATCVVGQRHDGKVMVIAFHGTTTFSLREVIRPSSDWGTNWCFTKVKVSKVFPGLTIGEGPTSATGQNLAFHGGYLRNYATVHDELLGEIRKMIGYNDESRDVSSSPADKWVICTGHSRGASMATIAATMLRHSVLHDNCNKVTLTGRSDVINVGAIAFSSPGTAHGHVTQSWVHSLLGNPSDIIRVHVNKDFVGKYPPKLFGYKPVGVVHEESERDVLLRDCQKQSFANACKEDGFPQMKKGGFMHSTNVKHYTINKDGYLMFDPDLAPKFSELHISL